MSAPLSDQPLLELVFAIVLPAIGSALLFNIGASSGGTDVLAMMMKKYTQIKDTGIALLLCDLVMVVAACFVFDIQTALYSFVGLVLKSMVIDKHHPGNHRHHRDTAGGCIVPCHARLTPCESLRFHRKVTEKPFAIACNPVAKMLQFP